MKTGTALATLVALAALGTLPGFLSGDLAMTGMFLGLPLALFVGAGFGGGALERPLGEVLFQRAGDAEEDEALYQALVEACWGTENADAGSSFYGGHGLLTPHDAAASRPARHAPFAPPRRPAPGSPGRLAVPLQQR